MRFSVIRPWAIRSMMDRSRKGLCGARWQVNSGYLSRPSSVRSFQNIRRFLSNIVSVAMRCSQDGFKTPLIIGTYIYASAENGLSVFGWFFLLGVLDRSRHP